MDNRLRTRKTEMEDVRRFAGTPILKVMLYAYKFEHSVGPMYYELMDLSGGNQIKLVWVEIFYGDVKSNWGSDVTWGEGALMFDNLYSAEEYANQEFDFVINPKRYGDRLRLMSIFHEMTKLHWEMEAMNDAK